MDDPIQEVVIRKVWLKDNHRPVEIYIGEPVQPAQVDWLAVTHASSKRLESFNLVFFRADGSPIDWAQFDTLEIALDQAHAIAGVEHSEWEPCNVQIANEDGSISWDEVSRAP